MEARKSGIIDQEEFERTGSQPPGRGHWARRLMMSLQVEQILKIYRMEWDWKSKSPNVIVRDINKKGKMLLECRDAADYSGWFIKRLE